MSKNAAPLASDIASRPCPVPTCAVGAGEAFALVRPAFARCCVRTVKLKARQFADELGIIADSGNGSRDVRERSMRKRFRKLGAGGD